MTRFRVTHRTEYRYGQAMADGFTSVHLAPRATPAQSVLAVDPDPVSGRRTGGQPGHLDQGVVVPVGGEGAGAGHHVARLDRHLGRPSGLEPDRGRVIVHVSQHGSEQQRPVGQVGSGAHLTARSAP